MAIYPPAVKILRKSVPVENIADQYLYHEFLKIFWDVRDKSFRRKLKNSIYKLRKRDGNHNYWLLVSAIAEGWRIKSVYRLLTNPSYHWNLEIRNISDLTMTGFNPLAVDRLIMRCGRNFYSFANYYHHHSEFFKKYMPNLVTRPERDHHPVFVFYDIKDHKLKLFDGMRRTVLAAINGKKTIKAYIGYPQAKGKPMVNLDKISYFNHLFNEAKKDKKTYYAFVRVGREMVKQSSNAAMVFRHSIKPWSEKRFIKFIKDIDK